MTKTALEKTTNSLVILLTTTLTFGIILMIANAVFGWDLFAPSVEKLLYFIGASSFVVIIAATLINLMINVSRIADHLSQYFSTKQRS